MSIYTATTTDPQSDERLACEPPACPPPTDCLADGLPDGLPGDGLPTDPAELRAEVARLTRELAGTRASASEARMDRLRRPAGGAVAHGTAGEWAARAAMAGALVALLVAAWWVIGGLAR